MNDNKNGFYGEDGEFYTEGSQSAEIYRQKHNTENLYPKRPDISYTTQALNVEVVPDRAEYEIEGRTKFCKFCGKKIPFDAVVCTHCGRQVEELRQAPAPAVNVYNNSYNNNINRNSVNKKSRCEKNKWLAFFLCLFLGEFGIHKFYEGKIGMGILYLCTGGLLGVGWLIDLIVLFFKPNPYTV